MTVPIPPQDDAAEALRQAALRAEGRGDWLRAADLWAERGRATRGGAQRTSGQRAVRALLEAGATERAEAACRALLAQAPAEPVWLRLHAEVATAAGTWVALLKRWERFQAAVAAAGGSNPLPPDWVFRIGPDRALRKTEAIADPTLRAAGLLAVAEALQPVDEVGALRLARRARRFHGLRVGEMVVRLLRANTRHGAAAWWLQRLIATAGQPGRHYPLLVETLLDGARYETCAEVLAGYAARFGRDSLWLRGMLEIHYRCGDHRAMRALMAEAVATPLPQAHRTVRVLRWLHRAIHKHPRPQDVLPPDLQAPLLRVAELYDGGALARAIGVLIDPARGAALAATHAARIAAAAAGGPDIDLALREEMLQLALNRRDWAGMRALLDLPLPGPLTPQSARQAWALGRGRIDLLLGRGDVAGAEATACGFLDRLAAAGLDGVAMTMVRDLLLPLPVSAPMLARLQQAAGRADFSRMAARLQDWQARHGGIDPAPTLGTAGRRRCFILGNGPSLAGLPLAALRGQDIFCVNRGMRAMDLGLPRPRVLVVGDPHVYRNHAREIDSDGATVELFFVASNCLWRQVPTVPAIPLGSSDLNLALAPLRHAPLHLHRGGSVVVLAAQIAHLMGYREIVLVGVDLDYSGPQTHFYVSGQKEASRLSGFRPGGTGTEMVNLALANLQTLVAADGCRLVNATPGGRLDTLERVDFRSLLGQEAAP